jgi:hypothetical protein
VFTPAPGVYATAQQITVNTAIPADAAVRYTTDGSYRLTPSLAKDDTWFGNTPKSLSD